MHPLSRTLRARLDRMEISTAQSMSSLQTHWTWSSLPFVMEQTAIPMDNGLVASRKWEGSVLEVALERFPSRRME